MSWADRRAQLLGKAPVLTVEAVFAALRERDIRVWMQDGRLRTEPELVTDDPLATGVAAYREVLMEMFTYAPGGRCVFADCWRLPAPGDPIACPDHRARLDAEPCGAQATAGVLA